jgi:hypothetical protein
MYIDWKMTTFYETNKSKFNHKEKGQCNVIERNANIMCGITANNH